MYEGGVWPPQRKRNSVITNLERVDCFRPSYERGMIASDTFTIHGKDKYDR